MSLKNSLHTTSLISIIFLVFTAIFNLTVYGAGELDTNFNASLTISSSGAGSKALIQPDGKILIAGRDLTILNGILTNNIVRLNSDGTIDPTFNPPVFFSTNDSNAPRIIDIALQSNGKILLHGGFDFIDGQPSSSFVRLNSDGSLDTTFPTFNNISQIFQIFVLPDDSFFLAGFFTMSSTGGDRSNLVKMSADGIVDPSFNYTEERATSLVIQPDGKIVVGKNSTGIPFPRVTRFNSDGTSDPTFAEVIVNTAVSDLEYQPDGKILIGGSFTTVNGSSRTGIVRANSDGTIDKSFQDLQLNGSVFSVVLESSGKFYIGGTYSSIAGTTSSRRMHRINPDGTRDITFSLRRNYLSISDIVIQPDGNLMVLSLGGTPDPYVRVEPSGILDPSFIVPKVERFAIGNSVLVQPDNKILAGGRFTNANGITRTTLARFNADGTLDTDFTAGGFFSTSTQVLDIVLQPDNKILICGAIGDARRLNPDGSLDITFPGATNAYEIEYLPDGKVLFAGSNLRRHNSDGSLDTVLATINGGGSFPTIIEMAVQPDGKIIIVGNFTSVNGAAHNRIARLNPDGTFDSTFNPTGGANLDIVSVAVQADGKILIGGTFTEFNSDSSRQYLARLNSDGSVDTSFSIVLNSPLLDLDIQADGKILFGGSMSSVNGQLMPGIARVNSDGTLDPNFNTGTGTNGTVWEIDRQSDGKIVYVGEFYRTDGRSTLGIGRLLDASVPQTTLFDFDGDGRADVSVFRPTTNRWYEILSSNSTVTEQTFGVSGDIVAPGDYDGDGKTDIGIFRPSNGDWWYQSSINNAQVSTQWGQMGDIPRPSDFDGDGKTDLVIFRPSENNWYRYGSTQGISIVSFGSAGDKPVVGDFDGDGKSDVAIFRPSTGDWWYQSSINNAQLATHWGISTDIPVPADYDGDGKTDLAVYRRSTGVWYIYNSGNGSFTIVKFGLEEDKPVPADYDGDGKADIAVFRPSTGVWYLLNSTSGFSALQFGISTDTPIPNSFVP